MKSMGGNEMLLKLSKNAFVRQYGNFTYVIERIKNFDRVYSDAEVFFRWITRTPLEKAEILKRICEIYSGANCAEIERDFDEFVDGLISDIYPLLIMNSLTKPLINLHKT